MARLETTACPGCATVGSLGIEQVMQAAPIGSHSLAGAMLKVSARVRPQLVCERCPYRLVGEFDGERHAVFRPAQAG